MHCYNLRPTGNNDDSNSNVRIIQRRQGPRALVTFKKPKAGSQPASGHAQYLKSIFATIPKHVNGQWCIDAAWHGLDGVYDEPISSLIVAGGYPIIYYLNDIHGRYDDFSIC